MYPALYMIEEMNDIPAGGKYDRVAVNPNPLIKYSMTLVPDTNAA